MRTHAQGLARSFEIPWEQAFSAFPSLGTGRRPPGERSTRGGLTRLAHRLLSHRGMRVSSALMQRWFTSLAVPIDAERALRGRRILGDHKTWRGLLAGIVVAPLVLELQILAYRAGHTRAIALIDYGNYSLWLGC